MDPKRQGEIALALVRALASREDIDKLLDISQRFGQVSSVTGIQVAELGIFTQLIVGELVRERLAEKMK